MDEIVRANVERYRMNVIANYSAEPLHQLRFEVASDLLRDEVDRCTSRPTVLEVAPGGVYLPKLAGVADRVEYIAIDAVAPIGGPEVIEADLTSPWGVRDESVDILVALEIIEHIFDTKRFLAEMHRVLKPGGAVILSTPNLANLQDRFRFLAGLAPRQTSPTHEYLWLHIRPFASDSLGSALRMFGFKITDLRSNAIIWRSAGRLRFLLRRPRKLAKLGNALICLARKQESQLP